MFDGADEDRKRVWARRSKSIAAVLLSFGILGGAGLVVVNKASSTFQSVLMVEDYEGAGDKDVTLSIPSGSTVSAIGGLLVDRGIVESDKAWSKAVAANPNASKIQAGRYRLKTRLPAAKALEMLLDSGNLAVMKFTVPEGLRLSEQYPIIAKATKISQKDLAAAGKDGKALGLPGYANDNPEGLLFPDTYSVDDDAKAPAVLKAMVNRYKSVTDELDWADRAKANDVSRYDMLIVASIIEAEVKRDEDRPKVARVLYNRLADNMPLQLDTTVMYANNKRHGATTSDKERANRSPYNTYVHPGLPPGPISAPGKASLEAAAKPAKGDWIYFVAVDLKTGETAFADDASGHAANVKKFQNWCQKNKGQC